MREIIFRAKVFHPKTKLVLGSKCVDGEWIEGELHIKTPIPHIHIDISHKEPIDINTIGEFTGCVDKNGKRIYEGDIVKFYKLTSSHSDPYEEPESHIEECVDVVVYVGGGFCLKEENEYNVKWLTDDYRVVNPDPKYFDYTTNLDDFPFIKNENDLWYGEVIGNIYDNPEILED